MVVSFLIFGLIKIGFYAMRMASGTGLILNEVFIIAVRAPAVFIDAHCLVLFETCFAAGMVLTVFTYIALALEPCELTEFRLDAAGSVTPS